MVLVNVMKALFQKKAYLYGIIGFLIYFTWIMGPYIRSVIVRDAAVTSWSRLAIAPIDGVITSELPMVNSIVGEGGFLFTIQNEFLFAENAAVREATLRLDLAEIRVHELKLQIEELSALEKTRTQMKSAYARVFEAELDSEIENLAHSIEIVSNRIVILQRLVDRQEQLADKKALSQSTLDETRLRISDLLQEQADFSAQLEFAILRRDSARQGVYVTSEGNDPDWVRKSQLALQIETYNSRHHLREAEIELIDARALLESEQAVLDRLAKADVKASAGSYIERVETVSGATVRAGETVIEWVECDLLLVDVPVSDAEVALLKPGMEAKVVLEGESHNRTGKVLLTRGSSAVIGRESLAAVAKGRSSGEAQVLVDLDDASTQAETCPVGRAAFVEFPGVGVLSVILARLRL
ncbi:MAG: multidrug resistance efflux pump [Lysobacterales bacterium]|jgi:multidrug resistance efflux pump